MNNRIAVATGSALLAFATATACATLPYPYWADIGRDWGCDPLAVQRQNIEYERTRRGATEPVEVQVGWDACEMLARAGAPTDATGVFTTGRLEYSVVYRNVSGQAPQMVTLEQLAGEVWRVTSVNF